MDYEHTIPYGMLLDLKLARMSANEETDAATPPSTDRYIASSPLHGFETYGWKPDSDKSPDENFMDLTLLITRSSKLKQGSMACLFVKEDQGGRTDGLIDRIVCVANNMPLFKTNASDIHAEIFAMGKAARQGIVLHNCTAYITMPPCKNCFGALYSAGFKRIVSNRKATEQLLATAEQQGISMDVVQSDRERVDKIVKSYQACKECELNEQASKKQRTA